MVDSGNNLIQEYRYDAFGNQIGRDEADNNPFRYSGEYWDGETENIYLRARMYDPGAGRFTSEDPYWNLDNMIYDENKHISIDNITQSINLYSYCANNPIMFSDPMGLAPRESLRDLVDSYGGTISEEREWNGQKYVVINIPNLGVTYDYYYEHHREKIDSDYVSRMTRAEFLDMLGVPRTNVVEKSFTVTEVQSDGQRQTVRLIINGIPTVVSFKIGGWQGALYGLGITMALDMDISGPQVGTYQEIYVSTCRLAMDWGPNGQVWVKDYTTEMLVEPNGNIEEDTYKVY